MLYKEIIAVWSQIHTKHINTLCGQNVELFRVLNLVVCTITAVVWIFNDIYWAMKVISLWTSADRSTVHLNCCSSWNFRQAAVPVSNLALYRYACRRFPHGQYLSLCKARRPVTKYQVSDYSHMLHLFGASL